MPIHKALNNSKKEINKAVSANMHELTKNPKGRSHQQMIAIAFSEAGEKRKSAKISTSKSANKNL